MNKYLKYFLYVLEHKKNVGIECIKEGRYIHAITHDMSKFRPSEFIPYARFFYRTDRSKNYKISDEINVDGTQGKNTAGVPSVLVVYGENNIDCFKNCIYDGKLVIL